MIGTLSSSCDILAGGAVIIDRAGTNVLTKAYYGGELVLFQIASGQSRTTLRRADLTPPATRFANIVRESLPDDFLPGDIELEASLFTSKFTSASNFLLR